ncbi:MAG TPA: translocation/assembly module TamB domain-containing protein, partial [Gemmatimonadaceae bacterium]|nr:translocation/assembly module TamB domain-containing protein [Gemmatimonadaceae bacterium]
EHVALNAGADTWSLAAPAAVRVDSTLFAMDSLVLRNGKGGALGFVGRMPAAAAVSMGMRADSVPMADLAAVLQLAVPATGWGTWHLDVAGTRDHPQIRTDAAIHDVQYGSMHVERIAAQASYAAHRTDASVSFFNGGAPALTAHALLPMELTLFSGRLLDDSLQGSVRADSADLGIVEAFAPTLRNARGKIFVALDLGGTWSYPTLGGRVLLDNGELTADNLGIHLRGITANLEMTNRRDSLAIHTLRAYSGTSPRDTIALSGAIAFGDWKDPVFDLTLHAHQFHAIDKHSLATLDVSTAAGGMSLRGPVSGATLTGGLTVDRGVIYMPDRDMAQKQLVDLSSEDALSLVDTTNITSRALVPTAPSRLVEHLQMGGVRVTLGDEVWLRSQEANIKLAGSLNVQRSRYTGAGGANAFARLQRGDTVQYRFALDGTLNAERGTYTLSLGPIQREFQVESGQIQFFGTPDLNPGLDITAVYNVRQYNRQDVKVRVHLQGFLYPNPVVSLESGENFAISQSDLISYLLYGAPSFEIASQSNYTRTAAQVLLPTASTVLTRAFRQQLGSWVDMFQFQAGATQTDPAQAARTNTAVDFFANARLGGEKQITNNLFFSFSAGLCQLGAGSETDPGVTGFVDQLGGTLQYRFSPTLSVDVGREPPSSALVCGRGLRGFVATPPQWGLSLSKTWRF